MPLGHLKEEGRDAFDGILAAEHKKLLLSPHEALKRHGQELGYDMAWVPDSQMIWSDCYATMALAAVNTKRIHIGTGVAIG